MFFHFEDWVKPKPSTPPQASSCSSPVPKRQRSPPMDTEEQPPARSKHASKRRGNSLTGLFQRGRNQRGRGRARSEPFKLVSRQDILDNKPNRDIMDLTSAPSTPIGSSLPTIKEEGPDVISEAPLSHANIQYQSSVGIAHRPIISPTERRCLSLEDLRYPENRSFDEMSEYEEEGSGYYGTPVPIPWVDPMCESYPVYDIAERASPEETRGSVSGASQRDRMDIPRSPPHAASPPSPAPSGPLELLDMFWQDELFRSQGPFEALEIRSDDDDEGKHQRNTGGGGGALRDPFGAFLGGPTQGELPYSPPGQYLPDFPSHPRTGFQYVQTTKVPSRTRHARANISKQASPLSQSQHPQQPQQALQSEAPQFSHWSEFAQHERQPYSNSPQPQSHHHHQQPRQPQQHIYVAQGAPGAGEAPHHQKDKQKRRKSKSHKHSRDKKDKDREKDKEKDREREKASKHKSSSSREKPRERKPHHHKHHHQRQSREGGGGQQQQQQPMATAPTNPTPIVPSSRPTRPSSSSFPHFPRVSTTAGLPSEEYALVQRYPLHPSLPPFYFDLTPFSSEETIFIAVFEEELRNFWLCVYVLVCNKAVQHIQPLVKKFWQALRKVAPFLTDTRFCLQFSTTERILFSSLCDLMMSNPAKVPEREWAAYMKDVSRYFSMWWQAPEDVGRLYEDAPRLLGDRQAVMDSFCRTLYNRANFVETLLLS